MNPKNHSSTNSPTEGDPRGWQYWKERGANLHAELVGKHKPAHVRAILKVLEGELLRGETFDDHIADDIVSILKKYDPRTARNILVIVDSALTRQAMGKNATEADKLFASLRKEFEPGPLRMILTAATIASKRARNPTQGENQQQM